MNPGDIIQWVYSSLYDDIIVANDDYVWSSIMDAWAFIGEPSLLISVCHQTHIYLWINSKGVFSADFHDSLMKNRSSVFKVYPCRVCK